MSDSDSDEEASIRYGTPLEPYEEDEIPSKRKYQEPSDQYALDAHGRRRFHGAFTGGFVAGHGNTVGTPEGWTPATFKSSRAEKATVSSQRPEDFMDEEDRSEFGIAPLVVRTNTEFAGQKRSRPTQYHDGPIPGEPVLEQIIRPVHETAAVRMLRAMGWRPGQGAGERVTKRDKRHARDTHKVYGCYVPPELRQNENTEAESDSDSDLDVDLDTLFAPDDYEPYVLTRKNDCFGLGYSGLSRHSVLGLEREERGVSHLKMKDKGKRVSIRGQAFGVGAFEGEDEDIYCNEDMSRYDFALGPAPDDSKKQKPVSKQVNVIDGFVRASLPLPVPPPYPRPALPRDYTPCAQGQRRSRFDATQAPQRDQGLGRHDLTPEARGALLGETPTPDPKPVETPTNPTPITEDPIARIVGRNVNFVPTNAVTEAEMNRGGNELNFIPITDSGNEVATVFKPFLGNPKKQARYERYLMDRESFKREEENNLDRLAEWERDRELIEFEQAAKLYRPLTGEMSDRFTHAAQPDDAVNPLKAVARSGASHGLATADQEAAARQGMYGLLTRTAREWRPDSLVCKRFNVPAPGANREEPKEEKPKVSYSIFSYLESSVHDKQSFTEEQSKFSGSKSFGPQSKVTESHNKSHTIRDSPQHVQNTNEDSRTFGNRLNPNAGTSETSGFAKRMTTAELFMKESEKDLKEKGIEVAATIEKFDKMDLYKSIFLSDSEEEPVVEEKDKVIDFDKILDIPKNIERNTSPPRGIFANIDFDELNSWKRNTGGKAPENDAVKNKDITKSEEETRQDISGSECDVYGPKIPENLQKRLESTEIERDSFKPVFISRSDKEKVVEIGSSSSSDSWVDVKDVKNKTKKKVKKKKSKKHKNKDKHKKSKHKKKDR